MRVTTQRHVWQASGLITLLSVVVPLAVVGAIVYPLPLAIKLPALAMAGLIPFFIALPVSLFALNMLKTLNTTVDIVHGLVRFDPLTGLYCRSHFYNSWREARSKGGFLAILDVDHFKSVNDNYGHDVGDEVLKHVATILQRVVGQHGIVGRLGGEEFGVSLPEMSREQAHLLVAQFLTVLRTTPCAIDGQEIVVTGSVGLVNDNLNLPLGKVMKAADQALYVAKSRGRDRCVMEIELDESRSAA